MNTVALAQDDAIERSARDLVERRGTGAVEWLNERIRQLQGPGEMRTLDMTYRILSLVERLLREGSPR